MFYKIIQFVKIVLMIFSRQNEQFKFNLNALWKERNNLARGFSGKGGIKSKFVKPFELHCMLLIARITLYEVKWKLRDIIERYRVQNKTRKNDPSTNR